MYTHGQYEVVMSPRYKASDDDSPDWADTVMASGVAPSLVGYAIWSPLFKPHNIRALGVQVVQTDAGVSGAIVFDFCKCVSSQPTVAQAASDAIGRVEIAASGIPGITAAAGGNLYSMAKYVTKAVVVNPGEYIRVNCTDLVSGLGFKFGLLVDPVWEEPGNISGMITSAT
jgi:hypothetical protein